jgi:DNA-binding NarL/FixJ family response regulator
VTPIKATVVIADDHGVVRRGVRSILDVEPDLEVVGEAADGAEAVTLVRDHDPDLAVLDVAMPRMTGLQATREITRRHPRTRVLVLSMHDDEQYLFEALRSGASGYVLKSGVDRDLVDACRAALRGAPFLYPDAVAALVRDHLRDGASPPEEILTPRELEVVKLIAEAQTNDQIAAALVISPKTVERHRANILEKLGMHDRVELTRYAIRRGLVQP